MFQIRPTLLASGLGRKIPDVYKFKGFVEHFRNDEAWFSSDDAVASFGCVSFAVDGKLHGTVW